MFVSEATDLALKATKGIARQSWGPGFKTYLIPTNTENGCLFVSAAEGEVVRGWQPQADDLIADDWEVVF